MFNCSTLCVQLSVTPCTAAPQATLSMGFSGQGYWSGLPLPPGNLPNPGVKPASPESPAFASGFFSTELPGKPYLLGKEKPQIVTQSF